MEEEAAAADEGMFSWPVSPSMLVLGLTVARIGAALDVDAISDSFESLLLGTERDGRLFGMFKGLVVLGDSQSRSPPTSPRSKDDADDAKRRVAAVKQEQLLDAARRSQIRALVAKLYPKALHAFEEWTEEELGTLRWMLEEAHGAGAGTVQAPCDAEAREVLARSLLEAMDGAAARQAAPWWPSLKGLDLVGRVLLDSRERREFGQWATKLAAASQLATLAGYEEGSKADKRASMSKAVERARVRGLLNEWRLRELLTLLQYGARQAASLKERGHGLELNDMLSKNMIVVAGRLWAAELADRHVSDAGRFVRIRAQVTVFTALLSQVATRLVERFVDTREQDVRAALRMRQQHDTRSNRNSSTDRQ